MFPIIFHVDNVVSVFASVGTLASAFAAFLTIIQVKKQRQASYQPDIYLGFLGSTYVSIGELNNNKKLRIVCVWDKEPPVEMHGLVHTLENIGLGAAKDLKITWEFDFVKAGQTLAGFTDGDLQFDNNPFCPTLKKADVELYAFPWLSDLDSILVTKYDFVLPRKDEKFTMSPAIPDDIIQYHILFFLLRYNLLDADSFQGFVDEEFKELPPVNCSLSYADIGGKRYKKRFRVSLSVSFDAYKAPVELLKVKSLRFSLYAEAKEL